MYVSDIISVLDNAVSINLYVFYLAVYICTCMSIRLPVHEHLCAKYESEFFSAPNSISERAWINNLFGNFFFAFTTTYNG